MDIYEVLNNVATRRKIYFGEGLNSYIPLQEMFKDYRPYFMFKIHKLHTHRFDRNIFQISLKHCIVTTNDAASKWWRVSRMLNSDITYYIIVIRVTYNAEPTHNT